MKDVEITATINRSYLVRATTRRFGADAVLFESCNWNECLGYLRRYGIDYTGIRPAFPRHRANGTTITRYLDHWNPCKVWLVKRYADGHYALNQEINGFVFYDKYQRVPLWYIEQVVTGYTRHNPQKRSRI